MDQIPHSASLRILVIRLSAMGDVAMVAPVLAALRKSYPNLQITMLTPKFLQPFFREVGEMCFFSPDLKNRHKGIRGLLRLGHEIGRFDMVADLHDVLRSKGLCKLLRWKGAKIERIDKGRAEKKALTAPKNKIKVQLKTTIERDRDDFIRLGFDIPQIPLPQRIHYPMSSETLALAGVRKHFWIGVSPFAQHTGKIYPPEKMREVILRLADIPDTRIFIFGGGVSEKQFAEETAALKENIVSVIGQIKLGQEMELISNLDLMVSMDSSALHMSSLVGLPVISIWGATHPYAGFYGFGQDPDLAVQIDMECRPCSVYGNKPCLTGDYRCMADIAPEKVIKKVCDFLQVSLPEKNDVRQKTKIT